MPSQFFCSSILLSWVPPCRDSSNCLGTFFGTLIREGLGFTSHGTCCAFLSRKAGLVSNPYMFARMLWLPGMLWVFCYYPIAPRVWWCRRDMIIGAVGESSVSAVVALLCGLRSVSACQMWWIRCHGSWVMAGRLDSYRIPGWLICLWVDGLPLLVWTLMTNRSP